MSDIMSSFRLALSSYSDPSLRESDRIDYLHDETGLPQSDVLEFRLSGNRKFVVRPSGTEPKLKIYLFARGADQAAAEKELDRLEALVSSFC